MKRYLLLLFLALTTNLWAASTISKSCEDTGFINGTWQDLTRLEPRLASFLTEIGQASGEPGPDVYVTNCRVTWPIDESGQPIDGLRTVVIDKVWYTPNKDGGPQLVSHGGMKIFYYLNSKVTRDHLGNHCTHHVRRVQGMVFCRNPDICRSLGIPFADPREEPLVPARRIPIVTESIIPSSH